MLFFLPFATSSDTTAEIYYTGKNNQQRKSPNKCHYLFFEPVVANAFTLYSKKKGFLSLLYTVYLLLLE